MNRIPSTPVYRGRFAPTPSGPLHLGSLCTALASFLDARSNSGAWLVRIDDLDGPRCRPGLDAVILRQLEAHGLLWDEAPRYQSAQVDEYRSALATLQGLGRVYACVCTRAALERVSAPGPDGPVYAGTCRHAGLGASGAALRWQVDDRSLCFEDRVQGSLCRALAQDVGDFTIWRRDRLVGYQLACAVDEAAQQITHVVRGADLIGSTFRQLVLLDALDRPRPGYAHVAVLVDVQGRKLSKQNHALAIDSTRAAANLVRCLALLGCAPPPELAQDGATALLNWAASHWHLETQSRRREITVE